MAYINTPMFTKDGNGIVRVRARQDVDVSTDIEKTAACYCTNEGIWYWRIKVSPDMMRGSGELCRMLSLNSCGCNLGDRIEVRANADRSHSVGH